MTVVDLLILGVISYALVVFTRVRKRLTNSRTRHGFAGIIVGLSVIALFYLTDLLTMHVLPLFMPMAKAMGLMRDLHLEYQWSVALFGVGSIALGLAAASRGTLVLIGDLEKSRTDLQKRVADLEKAQRRLEMQGEDQVRLADDLLVARDEARAADRAKSEFLAAMSHELRTPLNAVIGFSEIIKDETFGPVGSVKYRDYAIDINESGQHLLGLINDILDLSKIEFGNEELHEDTIEISEVIRTALKLVEQHAEQDGIKLELELPDQLPALCADERKLKQILVNLLSNAVKFTEAGGEVTLRAWCRRDSGYVFQITDTGIGIAPADIPMALSRFGQVDADLNRKYEGTGLGLPLTKALIELHGGTLDLQSQVGVGTTVTVRLPAERIVRSPHGTKAISTGDRKAG